MNERDVRPRFQSGEQMRFVDRFQRFHDQEHYMFSEAARVIREMPQATHLLFTATTAEGYMARLPMEMIEPMFERFALSFRLQGLDYGLDLGHDELLRRCTTEFTPHQPTTDGDIPF